MTLPDPQRPLNPGHVFDGAVEEEVLPPVTESKEETEEGHGGALEP